MSQGEPPAAQDFKKDFLKLWAADPFETQEGCLHLAIFDQHPQAIPDRFRPEIV